MDTHFLAGMRLSSPIASQEAGRLDNYCHLRPIQMSIKLFRAWHHALRLGEEEKEEEV